MKESTTQRIAREYNLPVKGVEAVSGLLSDGATIPFIARYRKEATGSLDEVQIEQIRDRLKQLLELDARRESILKSLQEQGVLTDALKAQVDAAETMTRLEDLYLPYKPKRKTRASIAREKGLEPLADWLLNSETGDPLAEAAAYVSAEREVADADVALAGARDIIAERISDDAETRASVRKLYLEEGVLRSEVLPTQEEAGAKYRDYFDWEEPVRSVPSHRLLAIRRGSQEGFLSFTMRPPEERALALIEKHWVRGSGALAEQLQKAASDSYRRLLQPSMETEIRLHTRKQADVAAIDVFAENVRELLMESPLGQKRLLAIDPGFRTGCKTVALSSQGDLLEDTVIYPGMGRGKDVEAEDLLTGMVHRHRIEVIAIGNGTGSREVEAFVRRIPFEAKPVVVVVSETGASVYSASEVARTEFPDKDLTVRGAVSIGRRLMDPLAELVKIDPKSIGVGQYQHDVDQRLLKNRLDDVVVSCVNRVGVEVNTASEQLLSYVSGLNSRLAANIVKRRREKGPFRSRKQLMDVDGMGPKAFEQSAGFLRVHGGEHPLDASAVHPERYSLVERMATDLGLSLTALLNQPEQRQRIRLESYCSDEVGMPTLKDIVSELEKPGRDPREAFQAFAFSDEVHTLDDLKPGQKLPGKVTNVAAFGAFVDIGVHQDGLVHISQIADRFVKNPAEIVKVGQTVEVTVVEVDAARRRIGLSMKKEPDYPGQTRSQGKPERGRGQRKPSDRPQRSKSNGIGGNWFEDALKKGK